MKDIVTSLPELAIDILEDPEYIRRDTESIRDEDSQVLLDHGMRERRTLVTSPLFF